MQLLCSIIIDHHLTKLKVGTTGRGHLSSESMVIGTDLSFFLLTSLSFFRVLAPPTSLPLLPDQDEDLDKLLGRGSAGEFEGRLMWVWSYVLEVYALESELCFRRDGF